MTCHSLSTKQRLWFLKDRSIPKVEGASNFPSQLQVLQLLLSHWDKGHSIIKKGEETVAHITGKDIRTAVHQLNTTLVIV